MEALLGIASDTQVANALELDYLRVRARRRVLGIPKFRFQEIPRDIPIDIRRASAAYLLGAFLSDGHLSWPGRDPHPTWNIRDEPFAVTISAALSNLGCPHDLRKTNRREAHHKDAWNVREKAAGRFGTWLRKVTFNKDRLPKIPSELVRPLVAGLMDGDGSMGGTPAEKGHFKLSYSGGAGFVLDFRELLGNLGIRQGKLIDKSESNPRGGYRSSCYYWSINIEDYLAQGLTFAMPRKRRRLVQWCNMTIRSNRSPLRKPAIAKWWLNTVFVQDCATTVPLGEFIYSL